MPVHVTTTNRYRNPTISVRDFGAVGDGTTDDTTAIQAAIDYAESLVASVWEKGGVIYFPGGEYLVTSTLTINESNIVLRGDSPDVSFIQFVPVANDICVHFAQSAPTDIIRRGCGVEKLGFRSDDLTFQKTAIRMDDISIFNLKDVFIGRGGAETTAGFWWTNDAGSDNCIGLDIRGREGLFAENVQIHSDTCIVGNPNPSNTPGNTIDYFHLKDCFLYTSNGNGTCIDLDNSGPIRGLYLEHVAFIKCLYGLKHVVTSDTGYIANWLFSNCMCEQLSTDGWPIYIDRSAGGSTQIENLTIHNWSGPSSTDNSNGFYFDNVRRINFTDVYANPENTAIVVKNCNNFSGTNSIVGTGKSVAPTEWVTSTSYTIGDLTTNDNGYEKYECISNHTSSATDEPGVGASWETYWVLLADIDTMKVSYASGDNICWTRAIPSNTWDYISNLAASLTNVEVDVITNLEDSTHRINNVNKAEGRLAYTTDDMSLHVADGSAASDLWINVNPDIKVKDFGAVGDGVTNDATAIQSAINKAATLGVKCVFESGLDYNISANVTIPSNTHITTTGAERAIISGTGEFVSKGTATGNTSNLSANVEYGDISFDVVSGTGFSADDIVTLKVSSSEADLLVVYEELAEIASVATNTITLKEPVKNRYRTGWSGVGALGPTTSTVPGLSNIFASKDSAIGNGTLAYTASTNQMTWTENGDTAGTAITINEDGYYRAFSNNGEWIGFFADQSVLDVGDATDSTVSIGASTQGYPGTFTVAPSLIVVNSLIENVWIDNITFDTAQFQYEYIKNLRVTRCKQTGNTWAQATALGAKENVYLDIEVTQTLDAQANTGAIIYSTHNFEAHIKTYGGSGEGIRCGGNSNGTIYANIQECTTRAIYDNCNAYVDYYPTVVGTRDNDTNLECLQLDASYHCNIINPYIDEPNKNGVASGHDIIEFRNGAHHCFVKGGTILLDNCNGFIFKTDARNCGIIDTTFIYKAYTGNAFCGQWQWTSAAYENSVWTIKGLKILNETGGDLSVSLFRSASDQYVPGYEISLLDMRNNYIENDTGTNIVASTYNNVTLTGTTSINFGTIRFQNNTVYNDGGILGTWRVPASIFISTGNTMVGGSTGATFTQSNITTVVEADNIG